MAGARMVKILHACTLCHVQHKDDKPPLKVTHFKFWRPQWYFWNGWS